MTVDLTVEALYNDGAYVAINCPNWRRPEMVFKTHPQLAVVLVIDQWGRIHAAEAITQPCPQHLTINLERPPLQP